MSKPELYSTKPTQLYAMRLTGFGASDIDIYRWVESQIGSFDPHLVSNPEKGVAVDPVSGFMMIATPMGKAYAKPGDWVVRGVMGDFKAFKSDVFDATYEKVEVLEPSPYGPHSRACGIHQHNHGHECSTNCPTCGGK